MAPKIDMEHPDFAALAREAEQLRIEAEEARLQELIDQKEAEQAELLRQRAVIIANFKHNETLQLAELYGMDEEAPDDIELDLSINQKMRDVEAFVGKFTLDLKKTRLASDNILHYRLIYRGFTFKFKPDTLWNFRYDSICLVELNKEKYTPHFIQLAHTHYNYRILNYVIACLNKLFNHQQLTEEKFDAIMQVLGKLHSFKNRLIREWVRLVHECDMLESESLVVTEDEEEKDEHDEKNGEEIEMKNN